MFLLLSSYSTGITPIMSAVAVFTLVLVLFYEGYLVVKKKCQPKGRLKASKGPFIRRPIYRLGEITRLSDISAFSKFQTNIAKLFIWEARYIGK